VVPALSEAASIRPPQRPHSARSSAVSTPASTHASVRPHPPGNRHDGLPRGCATAAELMCQNGVPTHYSAPLPSYLLCARPTASDRTLRPRSVTRTTASTLLSIPVSNIGRHRNGSATATQKPASAGTRPAAGPPSPRCPPGTRHRPRPRSVPPPPRAPGAPGRRSRPRRWALALRLPSSLPTRPHCSSPRRLWRELHATWL